MADDVMKKAATVAARDARGARLVPGEPAGGTGSTWLRHGDGGARVAALEGRDPEVAAAVERLPSFAA